MRKAILVCCVLLIAKISWSQVIYTFNGNGKWSDSTNWVNRLVPPSILLEGDSIKINPTNGGECVLDTFLLVSYGASLIILPNKKLKIIEDLYSYSSIADTLSLEDDSVIAAADTRMFDISEIFSVNLRPSKATSNSQYYDYIENVLKAAIDLCNVNRPEFHFLEDDINDPKMVGKEPEQVGLAYVSSGLNVYAEWEKKRFANGKCPEYLHGLECNGFVSRVLLDAGVKLKNDIRLTTEQFKDPSVLNKQLSASPGYSNLKYLPGVLKYDLSKVRPGDIIYWKGHVGICLRYPANPDGEVWVYQSNGSPSDCIKNKPKDNRGPHAVKLNTIIKWPNFSNYSISILERPKLPTLTTTDVSPTSSISANSGGNIIDDGGSSITAFGICWSTSPDPVIETSQKVDGAGTFGIGTFTSSITAEPGTYHARAFATNSVGTGYGNDIAFTLTPNKDSCYYDFICDPPNPRVFSGQFNYTPGILQYNTINKSYQVCSTITIEPVVVTYASNLQFRMLRGTSAELSMTWNTFINDGCYPWSGAGEITVRKQTFSCPLNSGKPIPIDSSFQESGANVIRK